MRYSICIRHAVGLVVDLEQTARWLAALAHAALAHAHAGRFGDQGFGEPARLGVLADHRAERTAVAAQAQQPIFALFDFGQAAQTRQQVGRALQARVSIAARGRVVRCDAPTRLAQERQRLLG
jgi:hypothetical protein